MVDTVAHNNPIESQGTGYCFDRYEPLDLFTCMVRASEGFLYKEKWQELQQRAMSQNFSWLKSALEYTTMYKEVLGQSTELSPEEQKQLKLLV